MLPYITVKLADGRFIFVEPEIFKKVLWTKKGRKHAEQVLPQVLDPAVFKLEDKLPDQNVREGFVLWLKQFTNKTAAKKQLISFLKEKDPNAIQSEAAVAAIVDLEDYLKSQKLIEDELVRFDESDGQFHWNEELIK